MFICQQSLLFFSCFAWDRLSALSPQWCSHCPTHKEIKTGNASRQVVVWSPVTLVCSALLSVFQFVGLWCWALVLIFTCFFPHAPHPDRSSPCLVPLPSLCLPQSVVWLLQSSLFLSCLLCSLCSGSWFLDLVFCLHPFGLIALLDQHPGFHKSFYWTSLCAISVFESKQCLASGMTIILNSDNLEALHDSIIKLTWKATIIRADPTFSQTSLFTSSTCCSLFSTKVKQSVSWLFLMNDNNDCLTIGHGNKHTLSLIRWCELLMFVCLFVSVSLPLK